MSVYDQVKQALQDIVAPQLAEVRGELKVELAELRGEVRTLQAEIRRLNEKIDASADAMRSEIRRLDEKIEALSEKVDMTAEFRERLAALEARTR